MGVAMKNILNYPRGKGEREVGKREEGLSKFDLCLSCTSENMHLRDPGACRLLLGLKCMHPAYKRPQSGRLCRQGAIIEGKPEPTSTIIGGSALTPFLVTSWQFRGDIDTSRVATRSPTGATGQIRRTHQRHT